MRTVCLTLAWILVATLLSIPRGSAQSPERSVDSFQRHQLTDVYYSEGVAQGDINGGGHADIVYGPYWFAGPDWKQRHEIFPAKAQPRQGYANHFFAWVHDFNGDGRPDILTAGFPGTPAFVYENPGPEGWKQAWPRHQVLNEVSNEAPQFLDVDGDRQLDLLCTQQGRFGYATFDPQKPFARWTFHTISDRKAPRPFGHGLGAGDINGDQRQDILIKSGWFEQPSKPNQNWTFHPYEFTRAGGAEMHVMDVDGDGDGDVITSLQAHAFGLAWFEQISDGGQITFRRHLIMGSKPSENRYGLVFTEPHSVQLADIDGDGLKDIVTGKTYWSHHTKSPMWDAGAVVYWFKLVRNKNGVDFVPYLADDQAGIGRQVVVADINQDGLLDIMSGGMKGAHVLVHQRKPVDAVSFDRLQPRPRKAMHSGLTGEEAAKAMSVPPGFHTALAAGEPQIHQPIAFTLDAKGRVWVAEAYTYPRRAPEGEGKDRIVILEDTNGDGRLDSRKVFIEKLNLVSGLEVGFGGVWVGAAPYLLFIPDLNHDDLPDGPPEVLLDGFGYHDTHETLNSFIWGPDGWLYGCHGVFTHSKVGKPGTPAEQRTPINAGVWRYHPVRHQFEVFAWGTSNPWGVDFNDVGDAFCTACVIPHLFYIIPGARYQRQAGRHFSPYVYDDIKTIADHAHYAGKIADHAWWGHEPTELAPDTSAAGGGHAHCGAMVYLGGAFPAAYRNQIFMNNVHGNRVNMDMLEQAGSGYVGRHGPDFLLANDHWFRGINLKYGPDGSLLLIDWYDRNACHRTNPEIWDRTNGRIYRVWYGERQSVAVDLRSEDDRRLIEYLTDDNDWYVRMARKILQERAATGKLAAETPARLQAEVDRHWNEVPKLLRIVWAIEATGDWSGQLADRLASHTDPAVVRWTIRLAVENRTLTPTIDQTLAAAAASPNPAIRVALFSAMQKLPLDKRWKYLQHAKIKSNENGDANLCHMLWYAVEPLVASRPDELVAWAIERRLPQVSRWIVRRAAESPKSLDHVVQALADKDDAEAQQWILESMLAAFAGKANLKAPAAWERAYGKLMAARSESVHQLTERAAVALGDVRIFPVLRRRAVDADLPQAERRRALDVLIEGRDPDLRETLVKLLDDADFRAISIRTLAQYVDADIAKSLISLYPKLSRREKQDAVLTLAGRIESARALVDAIEQGTIPRQDVHAYHVRQIARLGSGELTGKLERVWGKLSESSAEKRQLMAQYKRKLRRPVLSRADLGNGRRIFAQTCGTCHTLFGVGEKVGPDLTGSNRADLTYLLENIIDPSAVLGKDYRMTLLQLEDGRVVSGLVQDESDSAVTIRTLNDTLVIPKDDIEQRKLSELSMMPEKLLEPLAPDEVRDLIGYLGSPRQVAMKGPRAPINPKTGKVDEASEAESLAIAEKTAGQARTQDMKPFSKDRWSNDAHLWWTGAKPGDRLAVEIEVPADGTYTLECVMTRARDYAVVQLRIDDRKLGSPIDLFDPREVVTTGVLDFTDLSLKQGKHRFSIEIVGAHPQAVKAFMAGLDYIKLVKQP